MIPALQSGDPNAIGAALHNDFAPVLAQSRPVIERVKTALRAHGALGAELTGTGSVVYGLFADAVAARAACAALQNEYPFAAATGFRIHGGY